jgi:uncharacterized membrane protein
VSATVHPTHWPLHPVHAFLLAASVPLFVGAALRDYAYASSYQIQWINFASWLNAGGLVFGVAALVCTLVGLFRVERRGDRRSGRLVVGVVLLLAMCVLGFIDALVHARDAWASMPTALVLSVIVAVLACAATWVGFSGLRTGATA